MKTTTFMMLLTTATMMMATPALAQHTPPDVAKVVTSKPRLKEIPLIKEPVVEEQAAGEATFVTGGIGDDERLTIEAAKANYNVYVTSARTSGEFVDEAQVIIRRGETEVLNTEIGPLLYVQLPVGKYELEASFKDEKKIYHFTITTKKRTATIQLGWKPTAAY